MSAKGRTVAVEAWVRGGVSEKDLGTDFGCSSIDRVCLCCRCSVGTLLEVDVNSKGRTVAVEAWVSEGTAEVSMKEPGIDCWGMSSSIDRVC